MKTWILVADGNQARVFEYLGPNRDPALISGGEFSHPNQPSREIAQEKRGRVFHSADGTRSAMERPSDPHEFEKIRFAARLADFFHQQQNDYQRLIVVADPKTLGVLRRYFSTAVTSKVYAEINKDLTKVGSGDLGKHLQSVLNINA